MSGLSYWVISILAGEKQKGQAQPWPSINGRQLAANQSRITGELSDYITENRRRTYDNIRGSFDRVNRQFSQYIRGVDT